MKKICLVVVGLYISVLSAFSQIADSSQYKKRKLALDEINLVSSYYSQDGVNSAVTGGIGTEKLTDLSNSFELKFHKYDKKNRKRNWNINMGVDYYTSASSDKIDPSTISSASSKDLRFYPSFEHVVEYEPKRKKINFNLSTSIESDYVSIGFGAGITKRSKDDNKEFIIKAQCYADRVEIILPYELRTPETGGLWGYPNQYRYPKKGRLTLSTLFSYSQVINDRLQLMLLTEPTYQHGFLSMPFHRVYFGNGSMKTELLPSTRFKLPIAARATYFLGDRLILRSYYRFYYDNWGLTAHTAELETAVKINQLFSISPFYRIYAQQSINYFAPYLQHNITDVYYSSNYDLSEFNSHFWGAGFRFTPLKKVIGIKQFELRYGHYKRTNNLQSDIISMFLKFR
ncbi:DUF3570 domain-containing protein [Ferruginibacter sp. SUN002]|uniref:DUF3570 domain-containing protein n=1 Tax=Ferruginibacter sp. SUN002 TaxID=2937789 RepID=UPI003D36D731